MSSGPHRGGDITLVGAFNLASLDPAAPLVSAGSGSVYMHAIFDGLFNSNSKGQVTPELVSSWKFSPNHLQLTLNLQHGVKFQDGTPFNAKAVQWNLERDLQPSQACTCLSALATVSSVSAPNSSTVVLKLNSVDGTFLPVLESTAADFMASPTAFAAKGAAQFAVVPVGAGPFVVTSDTPNAQLVLSRSPNYWKKGQPYLDGITVNVVSNVTSAFATLESGGAQFLFNADTTSAGIAKSDPSQYTILAAPSTGWAGFQFNLLEPPFNNLLAREAVAEAVDPAAINQTLYAGNNEVGNSIFGTGMDTYLGKNVPGGPKYNDPSAAQALVKQLGGLSFTMDATNTTPNSVLAALQSELEAAGMTVQVNALARASALSTEEDGNYTLFLGGDSASSDDYVYASEFFTNGAEFNKDLNDTTLTQMVNASGHLSRPSARKAAFTKIMEYVNKNYYLVPLWTTHTIDITTSNLKGIPETSALNLNSAYLTS